jgi:ADP-heptose:LPS heptosyltransferase
MVIFFIKQKGDFTMKSEIICIIDRSGSMASISNDAIGGFNTFLEEQRKVPGEATLTFVQFDTEYEIVHENKPLQNVPELNHDTYQPRGMTALLDAVGRTIDDTGRRLANMPEGSRPEKVIIAILTDGEENSSRKYDLGKVRELIKHQKDNYQWEFIFLGANQDAFAEAAKIGIDAKDSFNFAATEKGVRSAYTNMSASVAQYRTK